MIERLAVASSGRTLTFTRRFRAPRPLVFEAFSRPELIARWWGPRDFPVVECSMDFRPGGVWHYCLRSADEREHWARAVYREITPPSEIVYLENSSDASGAVTDAFPPTLTTVTFVELDGWTTLTSVVRCESERELDALVSRGIVRGFGQALDVLERVLAEQLESPHHREVTEEK